MSLAFVNNSRETYTPTHSGAIATCIRAVAEQASGSGFKTTVISRQHPHVSATMPAENLSLLAPRDVGGRAITATVRRARRRLTGWARPDQWRYAAEVAREFGRYAPSVAIINNDPEVAVYLRRRFPKTHIIHWFHNLELTSDRFRRIFAADMGITSMAVSAYLARAVEHAYQMSSGRVRVNLNGVDSDRLRLGERPDRVPVVGFLGRIAVEKGPDILLDAAMQLSRRAVPFRMQFVGDTNWGERHSNPYAESVERRISALRARGVVVSTLGHIEQAEIPKVLAASDIHVFPSRWDEPFGLALLEGMASGQPAIASATGGTPEVLGDSGQLFVREDAAGLARILESLLLDPERRAHLGDQSLKRAAELTWADTWARTRELVEKRSASDGERGWES